MSENPRIEELRRRVQSDPTSIAFAALAEEYRRAGRFDEAIEVCRSGLTRHPAYISARVTLGRALLEIDKLDEATAELEQVLKIAPENLTATRALTDIAARRAAASEAAPLGVVTDEPKSPPEKELAAGLPRTATSALVAAPPPQQPPVRSQLPVQPAQQPPVQATTSPTPIAVSTASREASPAQTSAPAHTDTGMVERLQHFLNGIRSAKARQSDRAAR